MTSSITFNPVLTTVAAGSFNTSSAGYIQGTALDQPAIRNSLAGGILNPSETLPMWGGVAISETTTPVGTATNLPLGNLGGYITRATSLTAAAAGQLTGFSVFDQDHAMINSPQSPVPLAASGMQVNFYRLGSGARIAVRCDSGLVNNEGVIITQNVSWDFTQMELVPYSPAYANTTITNAVWAATAGGQVTFTVGTDLTASLNAGDVIETTGVVSTAAAGVYNGQFIVVSVDATHIVVTYPGTVSPGTYSSGGTVLAQQGAIGALGIKLLDVQIGNSMTVVYDSVTGFATWQRSGNCAIILI